MIKRVEFGQMIDGTSPEFNRGNVLIDYEANLDTCKTMLRRCDLICNRVDNCIKVKR